MHQKDILFDTMTPKGRFWRFIDRDSDVFGEIEAEGVAGVEVAEG